MYPFGRPHWLPAFSTIWASPRATDPKNRWPASMISFDEHCPCEGAAAGGGGGGGFAWALAVEAGGTPPPASPARTRAKTRVRVTARIECSIGVEGTTGGIKAA